MTRLRYNGLSTTLGASLSSSATAVTFAAALTHSGGTAVPTIGAGDSIPLSILDSTGKLSEVVYLTAYTSGATTGTITRGQEGTTGVSHASGDRVVHAPTTLDIGSLVLLKEIELAADAASIAFTSTDIPTTGYRHLQLVVFGRTTQAVLTSLIYAQYNGDTVAANYLRQQAGNNAGTSSVANGNDSVIGFLAGATASANAPGQIDTLISNYRRTGFFKTAVGKTAAGLTFTGTVSQTWKNTAAIDSIVLSVPSAGANFLAGTVAQLYGIV